MTMGGVAHRGKRTDRVNRLYIEQGGVCFGCFSVVPKDKMTFDHIPPRVYGGKVKCNLQLLCSSCNSHRADEQWGAFFRKSVANTGRRFLVEQCVGEWPVGRRFLYYEARLRRGVTSKMRNKNEASRERNTLRRMRRLASRFNGYCCVLEEEGNDRCSCDRCEFRFANRDSLR